MDRPSINGQHRDRPVESADIYGSTLVTTLTGMYGPSSAAAAPAGHELAAILADMDAPSLTRLVHGHERGALWAMSRQRDPRIARAVEGRVNGGTCLIEQPSTRPDD